MGIGEGGGIWTGEIKGWVMGWRDFLVYCAKNPFTLIVIPGLTRNPVFLSWIPAGVYPDGNRGGNDGFGINLRERWTAYTSAAGGSGFFEISKEKMQTVWTRKNRAKT